MKKAIIFGASGFVGSYLLQYLLASDIYNEVVVVVRKPLATQHSKITTLIATADTLNEIANDLIADDIFIALGTTKKKTPDLKEYYKIDHDYPVLAAKLCKQHGAQKLLMVSAVGANTKSKVFYVRTKGEAERDLIDTNYTQTHIFRPSMIMGERTEYRMLEKLFLSFWGSLNFLFSGKATKYRGISAQEIALAMVNAAQKPQSGVAIYHWADMKKLTNS